MALAPGSLVGSFRVDAVIGAGGMGEVYRARDLRLGRDVALKVLPGELAGTDRLARFEREARLASALNHPNVVTLYEVGAAGPVRYLAMELVDGRTLQGWIDTTRPPLSKRLAIAAQVADGLAHAHRAGIVHRDLKPQNVMVAADGRAKILDFGVARRALDESPETLELDAGFKTGSGQVLGTVPYMSPEQVTGATVDFRSDQFAFGVMVYEMATGRHPFARESKLQTLSAIAELDVPSLASVDPSLPLPLSWIVDRCLAKDPAERYDSTHDLARDLATLSSHGSGPVPVGAARGAPALAGRARAALVATVLAIAGAGSLAMRYATAEPPAVTPPTFTQLTFRRGLLQSARFTADGATIVHSGAWAGAPFDVGISRAERPEVQSLDLPPAGLLAVSSRGEVAISRNCRWIAAGQYCLGTLAVAPLGGGTPRDLAEGVVAADWSPDGQRLAVIRRTGGVNRLEYPVGTVLVETSDLLTHARVAPDGAHVAYFRGGHGIDGVTLQVTDVTGTSRAITGGLRFPSGLVWAPSGAELWFSATEDRLSILKAVTLAGVVRTVHRESRSVRILDINRDGHVLMAGMTSRLDMFLQRAGQGPQTWSWFDFTSADGLSADGRTVLFSERGASSTLPSYSLYLRHVDAATPVFLGEGRGRAISPDGKWVLANRSPPDDVTELVLYPTGAGAARVVASGYADTVADFLPDSRGIVFGGQDRDGPGTFLADVDGRPPARIAGVGAMASPLAPDGRGFLEQRPDRTLRVASVEGPVADGPVLTLGPREFVTQWTADGGGVFVVAVDATGRRVARLDLATGRRTSVIDIAPSDPAGVTSDFAMVSMTRDGGTFVYSEHRNLADLILARGLE